MDAQRSGGAVTTLVRPSATLQAEFLAAVKRSKALHAGWVTPPRTREAFHSYLRRIRAANRLGYWVVTGAHELAGVINVSEIVRGSLCSGYLGYYAFAPHAGAGHMTRGLAAVLREVFTRHGLHRVEANIQPGNEASRALVQRLGFRLEGFSPRYLKLGGRWRDHERWALLIEDWKAGRGRG